MLFIFHLGAVLVKVGNGFIGDIPLMHAVRFPVGVGYGILLKVGKDCGKILIAQQKSLQRVVYGISLLRRRKRRYIPQRIGKSQSLAVGIFNLVTDQKDVLISQGLHLILGHAL